jgi:hypothetical protein
MSLLKRLLGRTELPPGFGGRLDAEERVLAAAGTVDGGSLVATSLGLWLTGPDGGARRVGWHLLSKVTWQAGTLTVVEAAEGDAVEGAVLITDRAPRRVRLADPGRLPETVQGRVEASIRSRHHRALPGGGAWFVQRKVPGRDGIVLQVRPDPGTDEAAVRQVAGAVAARIVGHRPGPTEQVDER